MHADHVTLVQNSFARVAPMAADAARVFYRELFALDPHLRPLFIGNLDRQGDKLMQMLGAAVRLIGRPERLQPVLEDLGRRHAGYGVVDSHFETVGLALVRTLEIALGSAFDAPTRAAWIAVYSHISQSMRNAMRSLQAAA